MQRILFVLAFVVLSACRQDGEPIETESPQTYSAQARANPGFPDDKCTEYNEADPDGDGPKEAPKEEPIRDGSTDFCKTLNNGKISRYSIDNHALCLMQIMKEMDFHPCP